MWSIDLEHGIKEIRFPSQEVATLKEFQFQVRRMILKKKMNYTVGHSGTNSN